MLSPYYRHRNFINYLLADSKFQTILSCNCGEMERKSEGKICYDHAIEITASYQNLFAGGGKGKRQTVARVNLGPEIAAMLLRILLGSTCGNIKIHGDEVLPKKVS